MEQISALQLTAEEKANVQLLRITDGILIGVTNRDDLTGSLILSDTITEIAHHAFESCSGLTRIVIPDSVTQIGEEAFGACSRLAAVRIPDSVTEIGNNAFCNIQSNAQFIVASNAVKKLLKHSDSSIQDEHIIVNRLSGEVFTP
ncbi:leucine-rich repeat domain-containing protein [Treponema vincentii]|uniref:leucine-rich repeat domain-containing protein n=1 Tax=Treponema vincentii TaxID=69710 RepID=UPI0020A2E298|nr:leucine-rich repeat domain-containing protein [Treponema vincentii]UTC48377.1 leucine-rich repeat domain-containing protein [Treponema vincentii]